MTQSEQQTLAQQADRAAERVSTWAAWEQEMVAHSASRAATDAEPRVSTVAVAMVKNALHEAGASDNV